MSVICHSKPSTAPVLSSHTEHTAPPILVTAQLVVTPRGPRIVLQGLRLAELGPEQLLSIQQLVKQKLSQQQALARQHDKVPPTTVIIQLPANLAEKIVEQQTGDAGKTPGEQPLVVREEEDKEEMLVSTAVLEEPYSWRKTQTEGGEVKKRKKHLSVSGPHEEVSVVHEEKTSADPMKVIDLCASDKLDNMRRALRRTEGTIEISTNYLRKLMMRRKKIQVCLKLR